MGNRKKVEEFIFEFIKDIDPSGYNTEKYKIIFKNMSDKQFDDYIKKLQSEEAYLVLFKPPFKAKEITTENNLKIAKKYGVEFFEHLIYVNSKKSNLPDYRTPIKYMILEVPYRRQSQTLVKKASIPENNKVIDELTYQPTGDSKGAKISYPELQVLIGMGLENTINELIRYRGGDRNGFNAYNAMFMRYGSANLKILEQYSSGVESTKTLKSFLLGMHISNTI